MYTIEKNKSKAKRVLDNMTDTNKILYYILKQDINIKYAAFNNCEIDEVYQVSIMLLEQARMLVKEIITNFEDNTAIKRKTETTTK